MKPGVGVTQLIYIFGLAFVAMSTLDDELSLSMLLLKNDKYFGMSGSEAQNTFSTSA